MFFHENQLLLNEFSRLSQTAGSRADYVQGGGGNTSVKLADGLMAIKASGFCLSDIQPDKGYAVLDAAGLREFYYHTEPSNFADLKKVGSERAKEAVLPWKIPCSGILSTHMVAHRLPNRQTPHGLVPLKSRSWLIPSERPRPTFYLLNYSFIFRLRHHRSFLFKLANCLFRVAYIKVFPLNEISLLVITLCRVSIT